MFKKRYSLIGVYTFLSLVLLSVGSCEVNQLSNSKPALERKYSSKEEVEETPIHEPMEIKRRRLKVAAADELLGALSYLPLESLNKILYYVGFQHMSQVRQLNRQFYQYTTGYESPQLGVFHQPAPCLVDDFWEGRLILDGYDFQQTTPSTIPSLVFYKLIGEARELPEAFWPYLKDSYIHAVSVGSEDDEKKRDWANERVIRLSEHLRGSRVKDLILPYNQINSLGLYGLVRNLKKTRVAYVDLSYNYINDEGVQLINEHFKNTYIRSIDLEHNEIGDRGFELLGNLFLHSQLNRINLSVDVDGVYPEARTDQGFVKLIKSLKSGKISELVYRNNMMGNQGIDKIGKYLPVAALEKLDLYGSTIEEEFFQALLACLPDTYISNLNFGASEITGPRLFALAQCLPYTKICKLSLCNNKLTDEDIKNLCEFLPKTPIEALGLADNCMSEQGLKLLFDCLPDTKIHTLTLSCKAGVTGESILLSFDDLSEIPIKNLHLTLDGFTPKGIHTLLHYLSKVSFIEQLDLSNSKITDQEVVELIKCLPNMKYLKTLDLRCNKITDQGLSELAKCLANTSIELLYLGDNQLTLQGIETIAPDLLSTKIKLLAIGDFYNTLGRSPATDQEIKEKNVGSYSSNNNFPQAIYRQYIKEKITPMSKLLPHTKILYGYKAVEENTHYLPIMILNGKPLTIMENCFM